MKVKLSLSSITFPTPEEIENQFTIGRITFDQKNGLGEMPNNQVVMYRGFAAYMDPKIFLDCVEPSSSIETRSNLIMNSILNGGASIASPSLFLKFDPDEEFFLPEVEEHEGRARALACHKIQPTLPILVHVFCGHLRARNLNPTILKKINQSIKRQKASTLIAKPFQNIFWTNKVLS